MSEQASVLVAFNVADLTAGGGGGGGGGDGGGGGIRNEMTETTMRVLTSSVDS